MTAPAAFPTLENLREAQAGLAGVAVRTPLLPLTALAACLDAPAWLKAEFAQPIGAFKIRGAYTALRRLPPDVRARGVVTNSSGNHGQGIACAAHAFGIRAVVVMPGNTPQVKIDGVKRWGGEVVLAGERRSPEQQQRAEEIAKTEGLPLIPPYDHPDVIAGQGTCGLEILDDLPSVTTLLVPVSGGGLLGGTCSAVRALRPDVEVIAVEPAGAAKLGAALAAGHPVRLPEARSMADGLLTPQVGDLTWPLIRQVVTRAIAVTEDEIAAAVRWLHHSAGVQVEPSGAVAFAALLAGKVRPAGTVVAIASGGNVDPALFRRLVA